MHIAWSDANVHVQHGSGRYWIFNATHAPSFEYGIIMGWGDVTRDSGVRWLRHKFHINNIAASRVPAAGAIKSTECLHEARKKGLNIGASYFRKKGSATFATRWRGVVSMRTRQNNSTLGGPGLACMAMVRTSQRSIIILMISVFLIEPLRLPARPCPPARPGTSRCAVPSPA